MDSEYYFWPSLRTCGEYNVSLKINECCLDIFSDLTPLSHLFVRSSSCENCNFTQLGNAIEPNTTTSFIFNTESSLQFYILNAKTKLCETSYSFGDLGKYQLNITNGICHEIEVKEEPESSLINFGVLFSIIVGIVLAWGLFKCAQSARCFYRSMRQYSLQELEADLGNPDMRDQNQPHVKARTRRYSRIAAVDVFRGITIALMIFVNHGGGGYSIFRHAPWNGLTIADLVFPWFVWVMGLSVALSLRSKLRTYVSRKKIALRILRRSFILIIIGLVLNSAYRTYSKRKNGFYALRIPGPLQRIGVTYLVVALTELAFMKPQCSERFGPWNSCADIVDSAIQWLITILFAVAHALITFLLPVPGCPNGYLGPGGLHEYSKYVNCTGGSAGYIDRLLLTDQHLYQNPTCKKVYHTVVPYDPEGILGTVTCIFCAFLGVHAGRIILSFEGNSSRVKRWLIWALILGTVGAILCNFHSNDGYIPVNKNLWSFSYVCVTASFAFFLFVFLYLLTDDRRIWGGSPFLYAGMNAITLYIGHDIMKRYLPWYWKPFTNTHLEYLLMNVNAVVIWLVIAYALYRNNIFIVL